MQKIRGNKWNRRICKWIASLLTVALLVNQSSLSVLAEEISEEVCQCDTRCSADSVNEGCPVCAQDYGRCEGAEAVTDTDTGGETENPDAGEGVDTGTGEETGDPDAGTDTGMDEETEDPDVDEGDTDVDTEVVSDVDAEDEEDALLQDEVVRNVNGEDDVSRAVWGDFTDNGISYYIVDRNNLQVEVTGHVDGTSVSGDLVIPPKVVHEGNEYSVVSIWGVAFKGCSSLTSIIIPDSVTSIEAGTFWGCSSLASITIPDSVTSIGESAFAVCSSLASITIPDSVNRIEAGAFADCSSLANITIPNSVTSIGVQAFSGCTSLTSITIPDSINRIEEWLFADCTSLASIIIPDSVTSIGYFAISGCSSLTNITIPDSVTSIEAGAFANCNSLASIIIPDSVASIEKQVFSYCTSLASVTIPDSVTSIGQGAFWSCSSLASITIPDSVNRIEEDAFANCSSLASIIIPDSVTSIEQAAFVRCSSLANIIIPDSVTSIDFDVFTDCTSLESIIIPNSVTSINMWAFQRCTSLTDVTILNDNISFGKWAFVRCSSLTNLRIAVSENISAISSVDDSFNGCPDDRYLTFLTEDGTAVLSDTTALAAAVKAYDAADGTKDGKWFGWKLPDDPDPDVPAVTAYPVTIKVNKDGSPWSDCGKTFALSADGVTFITDLTDVSNGTYTIYETTGATNSVDYDNTEVIVEVTDADTQAEVNYYTVTFYDEDTPFGEPQIVLNNTRVSAPTDTPTKDGYTFYRWVTSKGGSTEFDFINKPITEKTDIYASWIKAEEKTFTITASAGTGGSVTPSGEVPVKSGADQQFTITPDEGYRVSSVLVDGVEQLSSTQASDHSRAGIADAGNGVIHYDFENVTSNHTLTAAFAATSTGGGGGGDTGDDDDPDDNKGGGGSGGGGSTGGGGSGGGGGTGGGSGGGGDTGDSDGGGSDNSGGDSAGSSSPDGSGKSARTALSDTNAKNGTNVTNVRNTTPASKDSEPKTGDASHMEIYATIAMIAGLSYLLLYFADGKNGMTEEEKKEIVAALVTWAKNGSRVKKYAALSVIFLILVYYHSIGKRTTVDWKEVYER